MFVAFCKGEFVAASFLRSTRFPTGRVVTLLCSPPFLSISWMRVGDSRCFLKKWIKFWRKDPTLKLQSVCISGAVSCFPADGSGLESAVAFPVPPFVPLMRILRFLETSCLNKHTLGCSNSHVSIIHRRKWPGSWTQNDVWTKQLCVSRMNKRQQGARHCCEVQKHLFSQAWWKGCWVRASGACFIIESHWRCERVYS